MTFPLGSTLTVVRPGTPAFGGDAGSPQVDRDIDDWTIYPGGSTENTDHSDQVQIDYTAVKVGDPDVDLHATDQVRDPADPTKLCDVAGEPNRYNNPFGGTAVIEVQLRRHVG